MVRQAKKPIKKSEKNSKNHAQNAEKRKNDVFKLVSRIFAGVFSVASLAFILRVAIANFLPAKFFYPILFVLILLNYIFIRTVCQIEPKRKNLILIDVFAAIILLGLGFFCLKLNELTTFINENFKIEQKYSIYNVIVNKDSEVNKMSELMGSEIFTYEEPVKEVSNAELENAVKNVITDVNLSFRDDLDIVMQRAANMHDVASIVNNGTFESYISVNEDYADKVKIIGEIKIKIKDGDKEDAEAIDSKLAEEPFLLLINGIDTRTDTMPTRSLSDVNILAAVNPKTKSITLSAIPRDMYVRLHGTTGLKDKLTHSGARGGVDLTTKTIEDFIDLKIDRYIRVNFNFVTDLVDNIGGITVTNDLNRMLKLDGCTYTPGENEVDGKCALRFARERKSYTTGDRHRGENQEQVIIKILDKISHDKTIISNSGRILSVMNGSFDTNITSDDIKALVKMQLNDMSSWRTETFNINGSGTLTKTNSYPNQNLYVMIPDENTVNTAREKLTTTLKR